LPRRGAALDVADRIGGPEAGGNEPDAVGRETTADVTRYLAAAAYLDEAFRDEVIVQTLYEKYRFIAPSYGVNIGSVVRHCIASRQLSRRRDVILSALLLVGLWALHLLLLFTAAFFAGALLVAIALSSPKTKLRWKIFLSIVAYIGIAAFALHPLSLLTALAAWFVVAADTYERRYRVVARHMNAKDFSAEAPAYGRERPDQHASDERRIAHLAGHQDGNVVVYSGFTPFKGSGIEITNWRSSLVIDVTQGRDGSRDARPPDPVEVADLYAHVTQAVNNLALPGCIATNRFYISGRHLGGDPLLFLQKDSLQDRFLRVRYVIDEVSKLQAKPPEIVRQYADIKVASWQSELILSAFVRFSRPSHYLLFEWCYFVLLPLKPNYHDIDSLNPWPTPHEFLHLVADGATGTPLLWLGAPVRVAKWVARPVYRVRREQQVAQAIRENRKFDYGALGSVRESGSDSIYAKYFQKRDIEAFHKIIHRNLLASVSEFLQEKHVDTSDLDKFRVYVNQMVIGGDFNAVNMAFGTGAEVNVSSNGQEQGGGS
jgi:hypothetical protein